ncbi:hypothetical protein BJY04DRAFT_198337 [Aspergillus karnatakaensis]|uniref:uncharacterized protein n=1 Tax=Aspergillus karnatakaensis TaxID=1810916 RepID=UPI003CCCA006
MAAKHSITQSAFQAAMDEFKTQLDNDKLYAEILSVKSIDEVYDLTDKLQAEQGKKGQLRHLAKLEPYLNRLREYSGVIEVFLQVQPDIMALIWGPIKLLLQWTSVLTQSFDAIVSATADIGLLLPEFQEVAVLFSQNTQLYDVLVLFFKDILDFYQIGLKFFAMPRWKYFFESLWPRKRDHINLIKTHLERHTLLMRNEVRLEHIREEHAARLKALEHFKNAERSHRLQHYHIVKTDVNPQAYDDKLYQYHSRICKGTGVWLLQDNVFKEWLKGAKGAPRVLWLEGIPGAGKSFLASTVVDKARAISLTGFAFLSYSSSPSALNVLHSLMFQLAGQNEALQDVICHSVHENTKSDIALAAGLLKSLLDCAGVVYLIIDGMDEIDANERRILLHHLLVLTRDSPETRLFISSRREEDIAAMVKGVAESIRVNERNEECIKVFADAQLRQLFEPRHFSPGVQDEIKRLLSGLASKASGMFLYAKVVLNGIDLLDDLAEIHAYLSVLPEDLHDAYARIVARIDKLRPPLRDKARTMLGWVGCSPRPLTMQELVHALAIQTGSVEPTRITSAPPNLGKLCGPIVEVVDGHVQFVHFTVKEYLFSPSIVGHIDLAGATLDLVSRCIYFLCQSHYDVANLTEDSYFTSLVLNGSYNLHHFATTQWFTLIQMYSRLVQDGTISDQVLKLLRFLMSERENLEYAAEREMLVEPADLRPFRQEDSHSDVYQFLLNSLQFYEKCSRNGYHVSKDKSWLDLDPLTVQNVSIKIYEKLPSIICAANGHEAQCCCDAIYQCFGKRPFKCGFLNCPFQRHGFETLAQLVKHEKEHTRVWKCDVSGCEYEKTGFISERMRDQHLQKAHRDKAPADSAAQGNLITTGAGEILLDLVRKDEIATAAILLANTKDLGLTDEQIHTVGQVGSIAMVELLQKYLEADRLFDSPLWMGAIEGKNTDILNWLLRTHAVSQNMKAFENGATVKSFMTSASPDIYTLAKQYTELRFKRGNLKAFLLFGEGLIAATSRIPEKDDILISLWELSRSRPGLTQPKSSIISQALSSVARTTCSIPLARVLLRYGADLEQKSNSVVSPLQWAARKSSAENAELIKFLLFAGANPEVVARGTNKKVSDEKGARELSRWLGVSWSELVAQAVEYRKGLDA